jgi:hypothetical protein
LWKRSKATRVAGGTWVLKVEAGQEVAIVGAKNVKGVKVSEELKPGREVTIQKHGVHVKYEMLFNERVPLKLCTE